MGASRFVKKIGQVMKRFLSRSERMRMWYAERDFVVLRRDYQREIAKARASKEGDTQEIAARYASEEQLAYEELEDIRTERLLRRARALRVPLPTPRPRTPDPTSEEPEMGGDENWWLGNIMYQWNLTSLGEQRLRAAIREEEKARRDAFTNIVSVVTGLVGVLAALFGVFTAKIATEQKELSRLDHMPKITCWIDGERLVVENSGSKVRRMVVNRQVFLDVKPCVQPCAYVAPLVRYVIDDYYRDLLDGDFEGSQKLTYGLAQPPGNAAFIGKVSGLLQDSLRPRGLDWQGIETGVAVRVVYWDWVGTKMEECYWGGERISHKKWKKLVAVADSVRREGRELAAATKTPDADAQRVLRECIAVARK